METILLHQANLQEIGKKLAIPGYDRSKLSAGILHVGMGNFHRSHQAYCLHKYIQQYKAYEWGICAVGLVPYDEPVYKALLTQNGLYSLTIKKEDGKYESQIIGSIVEYLFAPNDPQLVINKMAEAQIKIISLTITEGGYNFNSSSGNFITDHPDIVWDLAHPQQPRTIFGYLTQALQIRCSEGRPGLSILSCDNIQHNGDVLKKMLGSYLNLAAPQLMHWVNQNVSFPNCMVDRITPAAVAADKKYLQDTFQLEDNCPVVAEPFFQWIIEDNFIAGRPTLEKVNVQYVKDVTAFENMKLRLLNAGHSLLGFLGKAGGHVFIHEAMQDPQIAEQLLRFYQVEAVPNIKGVPPLELEQYVATLQNRFANPYIKDQVERIIAGSSAKIPKFILPTVWDQIERGAGLEMAATVIVSWCKYLATVQDKEQVNDEARDELVARARQSFNEHSNAFLEIEAVFGDLNNKEEFVHAFSSALDKRRK